jgi:hypothetical protein
MMPDAFVVSQRSPPATGGIGHGVVRIRGDHLSHGRGGGTATRAGYLAPVGTRGPAQDSVALGIDPPADAAQKGGQMLSKRRTWLERIANWGTALAVPLVAIIGFRLLTHARDSAAPSGGQGGAASQPAPAAQQGRVYSLPIDPGAPPVVELRPSPAAGDPAPARADGVAGEDLRCAELARASGQASGDARRAVAGEAATRLTDRGEASRAEARALRCRMR